MSEINTDYELLQITTGRKSRSSAPIDNDGGVLHYYGPHVQIRRAMPMDIGKCRRAAIATGHPVSALFKNKINREERCTSTPTELVPRFITATATGSGGLEAAHPLRGPPRTAHQHNANHHRHGTQ